MGDSNERHESLRQLRAHRLTPNARLLIVTRHQEQPQMPLFSAARKCGLSSNHRETSWWPISSAPDSHVFVSLRRRWSTPCRWTSGARSCADASGRRVPTLLALTLPLNLTLNLTFTGPNSDPSRLSPTSPMPHSMRALPKFGEITRRAHAPRALSWTSLQSAIGLCLSARRLRRQWRFERQPPRRWGEMRQSHRRADRG